MNKLLGSLLFLILFLVLIVTQVKAADVEMTCNPNGCQNVGAIFNENGMSPGKTITKSLKVTNGFSYGRSFSLEVQSSNYVDTSSMGDSLMITITDATSNIIVYGPKSITQWKNDGYVNIGGIGAGDSREYQLKVVFNNVANDYQNQKLTFDLKLGFDEIAGGSPSTSTSAAPENSAGTGVLGAFTSIFQPKQTSPVIAPIPAPQILGAECVKNVTPWWIFLAVEAAISLLIIRKGKIDKWGIRKSIFALVVVAVASQLAHQITGCDCIISIWCSKYALINLSILLLSSVYAQYLSTKNK